MISALNDKYYLKFSKELIRLLCKFFNFFNQFCFNLQFFISSLLESSFKLSPDFEISS